jgi:hypothetical protein
LMYLTDSPSPKPCVREGGRVVGVGRGWWCWVVVGGGGGWWWVVVFCSEFPNSSTASCHALVATFYFDTDHLIRCITLPLLSSQVGLPWFIPPRGIAMCVGPHPALFLVLHYAGLLPASLHTRLIATAFWGPDDFSTRLVTPPKSCLLFGKSATGSTTAPALAGPLKASARCS